MPEKGWEKLIQHGIFAALFVVLLFYTINENRAREMELKKIIQAQTEANSKFADLIKVDLSEIKDKLSGR